MADDGSTTVAVIDGAVDVQPCGPAKPTHATEGQAYYVSPVCDVSHGSFAAADPAIASDYSSTEDNGGLTGAGSDPSGGSGPPSRGGGGFGGGGGNDHGGGQ